MSIVLSTDLLQAGHGQAPVWEEPNRSPDGIVDDRVHSLHRPSEQYSEPVTESSLDTESMSSCSNASHSSDSVDSCSEETVVDYLCDLLTNSDVKYSARLAECFRYADPMPPISKRSLAELEISAIRDNAKLRHDINFDRELFFRPNLDGTRGLAKLRAAEEYWHALAAELELYALVYQRDWPGPSLRSHDGAVIETAVQRRIPELLTTIRDILEVLIPSRSALFKEQLDVSMFMQMVKNGVCDIVKVVQWLSLVLKEHCAPIRDEWVDNMVEKIHEGVTVANWRLTVSGLRDLLGILEAMKLDVANHQIQYLRPKLIEDTVAFEQSYYQTNAFQPSPSRQWFLSYWHQHIHPTPQPTCTTPCTTQTFAHALTHLLLTPALPLPPTFHRDYPRLLALRATLSSLLHLATSLRTAATLLSRPLPPSLRQRLLADLTAIVPSGPWRPNIHHVAAQIARVVHPLLPDPLSITPAALHDAAHASLDAAWSHLSHTPELHAITSFLTTRTLAALTTFATASLLDVHSAFVARPPSSTVPPNDPPLPACVEPLYDGLVDVARRVAPLAVLHWRVWGPLVYVVEGAVPSSDALVRGVPSAPARESHHVRPVAPTTAFPAGSVTASLRVGERTVGEQSGRQVAL
ncbi:hypothetical protein P152DRAFT_491769 [Eremomyces bilateralis CBS 781.70]|uniref:Tcp11-domain-containing protein n=1 Tax=Eremomyces bilateralis CBS 781.70 TaxID=1392243 RepID=A0A6G1FWW2_9PEZI|nr:uncharacterized protein P152DRAFT_491769 [Eremomyces bilateralis CBS 781.70]KAF1810228.1 hypothetical protein P152DRAFT_491769 [Eremomyces bilateralis CBS 781.70]